MPTPPTPGGARLWSRTWEETGQATPPPAVPPASSWSAAGSTGVRATSPPGECPLPAPHAALASTPALAQPLVPGRLLAVAVHGLLSTCASRGECCRGSFPSVCHGRAPRTQPGGSAGLGVWQPLGGSRGSPHRPEPGDPLLKGREGPFPLNPQDARPREACPHSLPCSSPSSPPSPPEEVPSVLEGKGGRFLGNGALRLPGQGWCQPGASSRGPSGRGRNF